MFWRQNIHTLVAVGFIAAFGIGASYIIITTSQRTDFYYYSDTDSYNIGIEVKKES